MTNQVIPAQAVEAAAKAAYIQHSNEPGFNAAAAWDDMAGTDDWEREQWESTARAALEAAAPHMRETVTEWAAAFPTTGNAYNYHRTREEAQAFVDAMQEDGVRMIVMTREVLPADASEWKPAP